MGRDGLVVVDKPDGLTSHDVVARVRRLVGTRRVGHGGTLDPMATGVLIVGVLRATRLLTYVIGSDKRYTATIRLGEATTTDDARGEVVSQTSAAALDDDRVRAELRGFVGDIDQVPSAVSAIKVGGVRSYVRARQGEVVVLPPRRVHIAHLDVTDVRPGVDTIDVDIDVACSSGTYIRAIARDLGAALGVGGHLVALRRTAVGGFTLDQAATLAELAERADPVTLSLEEAAARFFVRRDVDAEQARVLSHGGRLQSIGVSGPYAVVAPDGRVVAIVSEAGGQARAEVVLCPGWPGEGN